MELIICTKNAPNLTSYYWTDQKLYPSDFIGGKKAKQLKQCFQWKTMSLSRQACLLEL